MRKIKSPMCLLVLGILSSCAVSQTIQYDNLVGSLDYSGNGSVSIATLDKRAAIQDGTRKPDLVGYMRSGVGIAYPVGTKTKNSLADDFSSSVSKTLSSKGYQTTVVNTTLLENNDQVLAKLISSKGNRLILVTLKNWLTDGYGAQAIQFDVNITVYDEEGTTLASKNFAEFNKPLGGSAFGGPGSYKTYIPEYVRLQIALMLNQTDIQNALR